MAAWKELAGVIGSYLRIGFTGPRLTNNSGNLDVKSADGSSFAELKSSKLTVTGSDLVLDSADDALTISNNSTQSGALQIIMPPAKSTDNYVLRQKAGTDSGVVELEFASAGDTSACRKVDTTDIVFGDTGAVTMFTLPANAVVHAARVILDTAFDGTSPTVAIGISGTTGKYMSTSQSLLTGDAGDVFEVTPTHAASGSTEAIIATVSNGSATVGAARLEVEYSVPA